MPHLTARNWVPQKSEDFVQKIAAAMGGQDSDTIAARIEALARRNVEIHQVECVNLNPATNVMNPRAEALLASGLGSRPSLGYPRAKYETGLEAIEEIEVMTAELAAAVFQAKYAEIRVPSGALANLYAFMATCKPGDAIIVPPAIIGGHVTHHENGAAGLFGLEIHQAPVDADGYTVDLDKLRQLARRVSPRLITIGGSLNLFEHPVSEIRAIADETGARVLFDAAHLCGMIAGGVWKNPLHEGAHLMTMSTYKSIGGPPGGLVVTNDPEMAQKLDAIAFPGMTANFDAAKSAALAITMLDWRDHGRAYGEKMVSLARALSAALGKRGLEVFAGGTRAHQFALHARPFGGGQTAAYKLRRANILCCGIGLPGPEIKGDLNGLRLGTPEIVRWGMDESHAETLAGFVAEGLNQQSPEKLAPEVSAFRSTFQTLHYINP